MRNPFFLLQMVWLLLAAAGLAACGAGSGPETMDTAGLSAAEIGQRQFARNCVVCHGENGEGVSGLGKDMTTSEFITGQSDAELVAFIKGGRPPADRLNTTGIAMPPRGGNPGLTDDDLANIVAYIRTLQN